MKKFLMVMALALFVTVPVLAQEDRPKPQREGAEKGAEKDAEKDRQKDASKVDALKPYRTKGNTWTVRTTTKVAGMEMVNYTRSTILEVADDQATLQTTMLDSERNETFTNESKINLKPAEPAEAPADAPKPKVEDEKIKVAAGEFDCVRTTVEQNGTTIQSWTCKKTGLTVKMTSKSEGSETLMELISHEVK